MPAARRKYEEFSAKYLHIASIDDVPEMARELYLAFEFVQPKVSDVEFKRLIALVKALAAPLYFPFYPKMVKSNIEDCEWVLSFDINQLYRFSLNCDLKLLRLFYQGLELSLPDVTVELFASSSANPLEGSFKYYRAAGCFVESRRSVWAMPIS